MKEKKHDCIEHRQNTYLKKKKNLSSLSALQSLRNTLMPLIFEVLNVPYFKIQLFIGTNCLANCITIILNIEHWTSHRDGALIYLHILYGSFFWLCPWHNVGVDCVCVCMLLLLFFFVWIHNTWNLEYLIEVIKSH